MISFMETTRYQMYLKRQSKNRISKKNLSARLLFPRQQLMIYVALPFGNGFPLPRLRKFRKESLAAPAQGTAGPIR